MVTCVAMLSYVKYFRSSVECKVECVEVKCHFSLHLNGFPLPLFVNCIETQCM